MNTTAQVSLDTDRLDALADVITMASEYIKEITNGINTGTYDPDSIGTLDDKQQAVEQVEAIYQQARAATVSTPPKTPIMSDPLSIKVVVLATNSNGVPEFHYTTVSISKSRYEQGDHYNVALAIARNEGYTEPMMVFDAFDEASKQLGALAVWI